MKKNSDNKKVVGSKDRCLFWIQINFHYSSSLRKNQSILIASDPVIACDLKCSKNTSTYYYKKSNSNNKSGCIILSPLYINYILYLLISMQLIHLFKGCV